MGFVYWITGLSGAGKTTVGTKLYDYLRRKQSNIILLDGDVLRQVFQSFDYSREGRKQLGFQYSRLVKMISDQGIDVVICTVAMYDDIRLWNRDNIKGYREVYLEVELSELKKRDQKGLYSKAKDSKNENVCGISFDAELPKNPDIKISNYGETTPDMALGAIITHFGI